jgi:transcriptional regulator with XRE-family HTH domain
LAIDPLALGRNLREAREAAELSQEQAAEKLGLRRASVSDHERGAVRPKDEAIEAYARLYGISVQSLFNGAYSATVVGEAPPAEAYTPNPALARDYPERAYEVVLGYLRRLERAGLSHEEIEKFERTLLNRRFAQRFRTAHGVEWTEDDYILHVESLWQAMMDALATRGVVP